MLTRTNLKNKAIILLTVLVFAVINVLAHPGVSYAGSYKTKFKQDTEKTKQDLKKMGEAYKKFCDKVDGPNPNERAKDAAGFILENVHGVPKAREIIEVIDKGPDYKPSWKRK
jgi:hypothetical protein